MGWSMYLHAEVKLNGKWEHYSYFTLERNYEIFAKIANVKNVNEIKFISDSKGIPDDATILTKFNYETFKGCVYGCSWFDKNEILALEEWYEMKAEKTKMPLRYKRFGYYVDDVFGNTWGGFTKYSQDNPAGLEDIRWVFWFD